MALSFQDSINNIKKNQPENTGNGTTMADEISMMSLEDDVGITQYSDSFQRSDKYLWYDDYSDDNVSTIDEQKHIIVNQNQINITQESNSQFIPFMINRYYDGFDLMNTNILIHYVNASKYEDFSTPVNVSYSSDKIKFAWLVGKNETATEGEIQFEIHAVGTNSKGDEYIYKTRPDGKLNVLKSLEGNGVIEPDNSWITSFMTQMNEKVAQAQSAANDAETAASSSQSYSNQAKTYADQAKTTVDTAKTELQDSLNQAITTALSSYYTKAEVDALLANIDLTEVYERIDSIDGLANFNTSYDSDTRVLTFYNGTKVIKSETLNSNPTSAWITAYDAKMDTKINTATSGVQSDLDAYKTATDADLQSIHQNIDDLPTTLASDYYTKTKTDELLNSKADKTEVANINNSVSTLESSVNTNKTNITSLGTKITDLETEVSSIDKSPRLTYDQTYDEEQILTLWEIQGEGTEGEVRIPKSQNKILGGGGGGGTSSTLKIEYVTRSPIVVTTNDKAIIEFIFSGTDSSGDEVLDGQATWRIGSTTIATSTVVSGKNTFDATDYVSLGTQKITVSVTDDAGSLVTKSWTVQKIDIHLESTFNDKLTYPIGNISFDYTPYGAISKDVHFILDGEELSTVTTTSSGIPMSYTLPAQSHGAHLLEAYITAQVNNATVESNHIVKDIIWYDSSSDVPVISCVQQNITAKQYDTTNIVYSVYDPHTESPTVILAVDGNVVSTLNLDSNTQTWQYKSSDVGEHVLTITCGDTVKTLHVTVEKLDIDVEPVTAGLVFDFNPSGKSNNDTDRLWSSGDIAMSVSDNFDWTNGGYQIDKNGDQYFCIKAGTSATINYKLFEDDAKRNGKEFKMIFKTENVRNISAPFLTCQEATTGLFGIGLKMNVHEAYINSDAGTLYLPYSEEDVIEFEFGINNNTDSIPMVFGVEDGVKTRPMVYSDSHNFTQNDPKIISIGSEDCDICIYRMKVYNTALTSKGIFNNYVADALNADEMIARYQRNQVYDENNLLTPESLAKACPDLVVIKLDCPHFTNDKKDFVLNTNIEWIHTGGDPVLDNWKAERAAHSGQGTTSNEYGAAGRNMELLMCFDGKYKNKKIPYDENYKTILTLGDGTKYEDGTGKITLTRQSVPTNYLNVKVKNICPYIQ